MVKLYWRIRIFFLALRWIPKVNLGDYVWYKGKKYMVHNGVRYGSWRLGNLENDRGGWVKRSECRKSWTPKNMRRSFNSGWNFYMTSWFDIWCQSGIKDWMRGCHIWPWSK